MVRILPTEKPDLSRNFPSGENKDSGVIIEIQDSSRNLITWTSSRNPKNPNIRFQTFRKGEICIIYMIMRFIWFHMEQKRAKGIMQIYVRLMTKTVRLIS